MMNVWSARLRALIWIPTSSQAATMRLDSTGVLSRACDNGVFRLASDERPSLQLMRGARQPAVCGPTPDATTLHRLLGLTFDREATPARAGLFTAIESLRVITPLNDLRFREGEP